jgi:hypothetical protein
MSSMTGGRMRPNGLDRSAATIASALNPFFMKDRRLIQRFRPSVDPSLGSPFVRMRHVTRADASPTHDGSAKEKYRFWV